MTSSPFYWKWLPLWIKSSLSAALALTVAIGILLPTGIAVGALTWFRQGKVEQEMTEVLQEKSQVLSVSLSEPVWNFNMDTVTNLLRASMGDPQVVRVTVLDTRGKVIAEVRDDTRRKGRSLTQIRNLERHSAPNEGDDIAGQVEVEIDSGGKQGEFRREMQIYACVLALQVVSSLILMFYALRTQVLKPIARLIQFSGQLAQGDYHQPLALSRTDELGALARQMDHMRTEMVDELVRRKEAEITVHKLAFFDSLTQLPNRRLLEERLKMVAISSSRTAQYFALLFLDLDNFKTINDTLGHSVGDELLMQIGKRLTECVRSDDTVARLGGDEFVVILQRVGSDSATATATTRQIAEKICNRVSRPCVLAGRPHIVSTSVGVTMHCGTQMDVDEYLKEADLAMYQAKAAGRNCVRFYDEHMHAELLQSTNLQTSLRAAIDRKEFLLLYQPQVAQSGRILGAECLVRWMHPERGLVMPIEFISLAEKTGLILKLGQWILDDACDKLAQWSKNEALAQLTLSVNISARQLHQADFVHVVLSALERSGAPASRLKLELTESQLIDNTEDVIVKMLQLKQKGVGFSLDDFGTGYSSLSYLRRFPLDQLKIDRSFVRDALADSNDAEIVKMVITLADSLGLAVIAEGVEHEAQRDFLTSHGCSVYQGYLFGRPMPRAEFEQRVRKEHSCAN